MKKNDKSSIARSTSLKEIKSHIKDLKKIIEESKLTASVREKIQSDIDDLKKLLNNDVDDKGGNYKTNNDLEFLNRTVHLNKLPMLIIDNSGKYIEINQIACDLLGFERSEVIGKSIGSLLDDKQDLIVQGFLNNLKKEGGISGSFNFVKGNSRNISLDFYGFSGIVQGFSLIVLIDLSKKKETEKNFLESKIKFETLVNEMNEGLLQVDNEDRIIFANKKILNLLQYTEQEVIGKKGYELFLDNDDKSKIVEKNEARKNKISDSYDVRLIKKDGSKLWVRISGAPVTDADGNVIGSIGVLNDISEEKKVVDKIKLNEEKFSQIFRLAPFLVALSNPSDGTFYDVNNRFLTVTGYKREDVIGKTSIELGLWSNAERQKAKEVMEKTGKLEDFEIKMQTRTKNTVICSFYGEIITISGKKYFLTMAQDITDRVANERKLQSSEQRFRELIYSSQVSILVVQNGKYIFSNNAALKMLDLKENEILGRDVLSIINSDFHKFFIRKIKDLTQSNNQNPEVVVFQKPDGRKIFTETVIVPIEYNGIQSVLIQCMDLTEKIKAEERLKENELLLRTTINAMQDIVCFKDGEGRWLLANDFDLRLFQLEGVDYKGKKDSELAAYSEFYKDAFLNCEETDETAWSKGIPSRGDEVIPLPDGKEKVFDIIKIPTFQNGERKGLIVVGRDITERKLSEDMLSQSEQKFRAVFENNAEAIGISKNGINVELNKIYLNLFGYDNADEIIGRSVLEQIAPSARPDILEKINKRASGDYVPSRYETIGLRKNGEEFQFELSVDTFIQKNEKYTVVIVRDLTERKINEETIRQSEQEIRRLYDTMNDSYAKVNMEGKIIGYNNSMLKLTGYNEEEIKTLTYRDLTPEKWHSLENDIVNNQILLRGYSDIYEKEYIRKDGSIVPIELITSLIKDENGNLQGMFAIIRDISARKEAEVKISELNSLLMASIEQTPAGILIANAPDVNIQLANSAALGIRGDSNLPLTSIPVDLHPLNWQVFYPNGTPFKGEDLPLSRAVLKGEVVKNAEAIIRRPDGEDRFVLANAAPVRNSNNEVVAGVVVFSDITELKKAEQAIQENEERLQLALSASNLGLFDMDLKTFKVVVSPAYMEMLGYKADEQEATLEWWTNTIHPDDLAMAKATLENCIAGKQLTYKMEYRMKTGQGNWKWIQSTGEVVGLNEEKVPSRLIGVNSDITERKIFELEIMKAKESAERSDKLKSAFLANMSHEIRTPMNGIIGFADLLKEKTVSEAKRDHFLSLIIDNSHQLLKIVDDLLDISKIETKQLFLFEEKIVLNDLLLELFTVCNAKTEKSDISVFYSKGLNDKDSEIITDADKLKKVLRKLLENALKFCNTGKIEFGYILNGSMLEFTVSDTGVGIPEEARGLIFERFQKGDYETGFKGAGLGLPIAKGLIEFLGGSISVESKTGEGARFTFCIPYHPAKMKVQKTDIDMYEGETILVVEDIDINYAFIESVLYENNYKCLYAANGIEAIKLIKTHPEIELILMDIKMPEMDGLEAIRRIWSFKPDMKIIVQTAYTAKEDDMRIRALGIRDIIHKPLDQSLLIGKIKEYLKK